MCCFLADGFCSKGKINERRLLNAGVIIFMKEQVKFKVLKNKEKDNYTKYKKYNVVHPRYKAKAIFSSKTIHFEEHDESHHTTRTIIDFHNKMKFPKNRIEYGDDFRAQNGDIVVFNFKKKRKNRIITSIDLIGFK